MPVKSKASDVFPKYYEKTILFKIYIAFYVFINSSNCSKE